MRVRRNIGVRTNNAFQVLTGMVCLRPDAAKLFLHVSEIERLICAAIRKSYIPRVLF